MAVPLCTYFLCRPFSLSIIAVVCDVPVVVCDALTLSVVRDVLTIIRDAFAVTRGPSLYILSPSSVACGPCVVYIINCEYSYLYINPYAVLISVPKLPRFGVYASEWYPVRYP